MADKKIVNKAYLIVTILYMLVVIAISLIYTKPGHSTIFLSTAVSIGLLLFVWMLFKHFYLRKQK